MVRKQVIIKLLWFGEIVVAARILFFSLPLMISQFFGKELSFYDFDDVYMVVITFVALIYLLIGLATMYGHKLWRPFHYLASGLVFLLMTVLLNGMATSGTKIQPMYFLPLLYSLLLSIFVKFLKIRPGE